MRFLIPLLLIPLLASCTGLPEDVRPVDGFDTQRYLGRWYEIARLDHSFERGLDNVTAEYSLREDGGVKVINRGVNRKDGKVKGAEGKAYFVEENNQGYLKVSFFGPFYGAYVVFDLDHQDYQYAFISGPSKKYLWLLARTPKVSSELMTKFINQSKSLGFAVDELIYVNQDE